MISRIRFAVSIAASEASWPRLPSLPPALSMACNSVSVVRTPNIVGTPVSIDTAAIPLAV